MSKRNVDPSEESEHLNKKRPRVGGSEDREEAPRSEAVSPDNVVSQEEDQDSESDEDYEQEDEEYEQEDEEDDIEYELEDDDDEAADIQQDLLNRLLLEDLQSADGDTVFQATNALIYCFQTLHDAEFHRRLQQAGCHSILLILIKKWNDQGNEAVQAQASLISCLAWFCSLNGCPKKTLINMRAVDTVLEAMDKFPDSPRLQIAGMDVVKRLCGAAEDRTTQVYESVERLDGVSLVYNAMRAFPDNLDVQLKGLASLNAFCTMASEKLKSTKGEAISLTGVFVQNFPGDQREAFSFLNTLGSM